MSAEIRYTHKALCELDEIYDYINYHLCNPQAAYNIVNDIMLAVDRLAEFPNLGKSVVLPFNVFDYRFLVCHKYTIFYHIEDDIWIDRIIYGRRDLKKVFT